MDEIRMAVVGLGTRGTGTWFNMLQTSVRVPHHRYLRPDRGAP